MVWHVHPHIGENIPSLKTYGVSQTAIQNIPSQKNQKHILVRFSYDLVYMFLEKRSGKGKDLKHQSIHIDNIKVFFRIGKCSIFFHSNKEGVDM